MTTTPNRIGFHYFPDDRHYRPEDLERWLPILDELDAGWLTLRAPVDRPIPRAFVGGLLDAGLQPIVHIRPPLGTLRSEQINPVLYSYADWGVKYVIVYDRPNLQSSWAPGQWSRTGLVERFLDAALPVLQAAFSAGLRPTLPPLEPGGDYWDTAFLISALKGIARRGQDDLLRSLTVGSYAWTYGRHLDWGAGGPDAWPQARPYNTPEDSQDQRGLRIFEWYQSIAERAIGEPLSTLVVAGGPTDPECAAPEAEAGKIARQVRDLLTDAQPEVAPEAFCFYLLAADSSDRDSGFSWYDPSAKRGRIADSFLRQAEASKFAPSPGGKVLEHYLLLPPEESRAIPAWRRASAFALTHRPVVGFSPDEAAHAEKVTIAGGHDLVPEATERALQAAGCRVQRLTLLPTRKSACRSGQTDDPQTHAST